MISDEYCRLCATTNETLIDIFSDQGIRWNIGKIVSSHFWFVIEFDDHFSNKICTTCWWKVENFHVFYLNIQTAQKELQAKIDEIQIHVTQISQQTSIIESIDENETIEIVELKTIENFNEKLEVGTDLEKFYSSFNETEGLSDHFNINSKDEIIDSKQKENDNIVETDHENREVNFSFDEDNQTIELTIHPNAEYIDEFDEKIQQGKLDDPVNNGRRRRKRDLPQTLKDDALIRSWCKMQCTLCDETFYRFPDAKKHYRDLHQVNGFVLCCNKKFFRRVRALEHIQRHLNPETFKCDICDKVFADKPGLQNHLDGHAPPDKRKFQCNQCKRSYAKKFQLDQHKRTRHISLDDKKFRCSDCGKAFMFKSMLQHHERIVHQNNKRFICDICAKAFNSKSFFDLHCQEHREIRQPRVQCSLCDRWLKNEHSLRSHMSRHADSENVHKCEICGKQAPTRGALRSHQKYVHFSAKAFKCCICEKAFKKSIALKEHMSLHTGESLYTCPYCPKQFNSGANMHSHKKKVHTALWEEEKSKRQTDRVDE